MQGVADDVEAAVQQPVDRQQPGRSGRRIGHADAAVGGHPAQLLVEDDQAEDAEQEHRRRRTREQHCPQHAGARPLQRRAERQQHGQDQRDADAVQRQFQCGGEEVTEIRLLTRVPGAVRRAQITVHRARSGSSRTAPSMGSFEPERLAPRRHRLGRGLRAQLRLDWIQRRNVLQHEHHRGQRDEDRHHRAPAAVQRIELRACVLRILARLHQVAQAVPRDVADRAPAPARRDRA